MKGMTPCRFDWETRPCRCEAPPFPCNEPCRAPAMRVPLFGGDRCPCRERPLPPAAPTVTIVNPWNCRERVEVTLSVDECGNLVVSIRR